MAFQLVRFKKGQHTLEVLTNPGKVLKYRETKANFADVLFSTDIFKAPYSKGDKPGPAELKELFDTENVNDCLRVIVEKGELQLTAAERKEKVDKRRAEIVNYLHKYYIDPKNKTPHPVVRIEAALDEIKARIDPDMDVTRQVAELMKKLPEKIALKKCEIAATLTVPNQHMGVAAGIISKYAHLDGENYSAASCTMQISIVPGDYDELMKLLQSATKGDFQFDLVGQELQSEAEAGKGKGKAGAKAGHGGKPTKGGKPR